MVEDSSAQLSLQLLIKNKVLFTTLLDVAT